jgi:anaerobic selenocysteine-containing dehydrogenase
MGIRQHFESPYRPGEKVTIEEYYQWIFENSVPGLPEAAAKEDLTPLAYMRKYGAFEVKRDVYKLHEVPVPDDSLASSQVNADSGLVQSENGDAIGVSINGEAVAGFKTPSRKLDFYSKTMKEWQWAEQTIPNYIRSHIHWSNINRDKNEFALVPTFRLPTLIHTRSGNSKWLTETAHKNPLWVYPKDAKRLGISDGDLMRVTTDIGYFIIRALVTEGIRPGIVACSHHLGRWRLQKDVGGERWSTALVDLKEREAGKWFMRQTEGIQPFKSADPESERIWWNDSGVHQNLTFPVHPDPISGMHCWHQKVTVTRAQSDDQYGDVFVDTVRAHEVYKEWLEMTKPAPGPDGTRRPYSMQRPMKPTREAYKLEKD